MCSIFSFFFKYFYFAYKSFQLIFTLILLLTLKYNIKSLSSPYVTREKICSFLSIFSLLIPSKTSLLLPLIPSAILLILGSSIGAVLLVMTPSMSCSKPSRRRSWSTGFQITHELFRVIEGYGHKLYYSNR